MNLSAHRKINVHIYHLQDGTDYDCGSAVVTWLSDGTLHPVWSGHRIYKNIECARCHGVKEEDIAFWNTTVICPVGSPFGFNSNENKFPNFRDDFEGSTCRLFYKYQDVDLSRFKCSQRVFDSCRFV